MKYYIIAGEASGDLHGSLLMKGLLASDPQAQFRFWGGEKMEGVWRESRGGEGSCEGAGGGKVRDVRDTAVMGVVEVVAKARQLGRNLAFCKADIARFAPDAVILIDYPGFNLKIAKFAHTAGFKVFYYIAPKVWATRERRVEKLRRYVDRLYVIFPFEVEWFRSRGIEPVYLGNPLAESIDSQLAAAPGREAFLKANGLDDRPMIALLAGSRRQEIKFLAPRFNRLADILSLPESPLRDHQLVVAAAPGVAPEIYESYFGASGIKIVYGATYPLLKYADAAAVASGTASLEAAIIGCPQVVCYGMNPLSFKIAMALLKVKYVSLANLILDKLIFKELLQDICTPEAIAAELITLTGDVPYRQEMLHQYTALRAALAGDGATSVAGHIASDMLGVLTSH